MPDTVFIKTFGCQMNEYDSSRLADLLAAQNGCVAADTPEAASVLLLNTCSVREKAQEKVFSQLGIWRQWQQANPDIVIGVGGCVASQEGEALQRRAPFVDLVFGPQTIHRVPGMLAAVRRRRAQAALDIRFPEIEKFDCLPPPRAQGVKAYVSVMEGCSKYCSFCVVPYTRGREFSRPLDDILLEVRQLADQGVREITLLGQNVNGYRGRKHDGGIVGFAELLHYVAVMSGVERLRYTTSHPLDFNDALVAAHADIPELVNHLHLPVQSGSDKILAGMKRGYKVAQYLGWVDKLRAACPDLHLSSDFIVGFPGETEADFAATMALVDQVGYDHSFSFVYSPRAGTPAASLADDTPLPVKKQRLARLQARLKEGGQALSRAMLGQHHPVLVEGPAKQSDDQWSGRTGNNRVVNFPRADGDGVAAGQFRQIAITEVLTNSLRGELAA